MATKIIKISKAGEKRAKNISEYIKKGYSFKSQTDTEVITVILTDFLKSIHSL